MIKCGLGEYYVQYFSRRLLIRIGKNSFFIQLVMPYNEGV